MNKLYKSLWFITFPFLGAVYIRKTIGRENMPEGAALICANHSSMMDPFLVAYSISWRHRLYIMAKAELFKIPLVRGILKGLEVFPVDRKSGGTSAVKASMKFLREGKKVLMFPEGTRVSDRQSTDAKTGAIRIAAKMGAPIVPIYIPRKKNLFRRNHIVIGTPYIISVPKNAEPEEYMRHATELMEKIRNLGQKHDPHFYPKTKKGA